MALIHVSADVLCNRFKLCSSLCVLFVPGIRAVHEEVHGRVQLFWWKGCPATCLWSAEANLICRRLVGQQRRVTKAHWSTETLTKTKSVWQNLLGQQKVTKSDRSWQVSRILTEADRSAEYWQKLTGQHKIDRSWQVNRILTEADRSTEDWRNLTGQQMSVRSTENWRKLTGQRKTDGSWQVDRRQPGSS